MIFIRHCILLFQLCTVTTPSLVAKPFPATENARHARADREHSFAVSLPLTEAFVLFEPVGEKNWVEGWQPVFASVEDATLHDGSVFTVTHSHPIHGNTQSVWMVSRYEPPNRIEYRNVLIGRRATLISVRCEAVGERTTRVTVRYVYTGLSKEGDDYVAKMTESAFREMIDGWPKLIANYLKQGTLSTP